MWNWSAQVEFEILSGGRVIDQFLSENSLVDEGERLVLDVFLRNGSAPASFRLRLFNDAPVDTDSLASLTGEPGGGTGYAAQTVNRDATANGWPQLIMDGGDWMAVSKQVTFDCTSPYTVQSLILATTSDNSGNLISHAPLSVQRTLASGEQLRTTFRPKMS